MSILVEGLVAQLGKQFSIRLKSCVDSNYCFEHGTCRKAPRRTPEDHNGGDR
jgi:hypothetical protein